MKGSFGKLRIIAGDYKGRIVKTIDLPGTRPMTDRVRENLFNIIQMRLPGCRFLDLFSGSGAVGLEAISRGASHVTFVERAKEWQEIIRSNIASLNLESRTHLYGADVFKAVPAMQKFNKQFDLIFIGAPYDLDLQNSALSAVLEAGLLAKEGLIIDQYRKDDSFNEPEGFSVEHRDYGITRLTFLERNNDR